MRTNSWTKLDTKLRAGGVFETTQKKKRYDGQFKISAAKAVLSNEVTVRELSEELAMVPSRIFRKFADV